MLLTPFQVKGSTPRVTLGDLPLFSLSGAKNVLGVFVYSFMCHHSLPALVTPMQSKKHVHRVLGTDLGLVYASYTVMGLTALFAFANVKNTVCEKGEAEACSIQELYTLNWVSSDFRPMAAFLSLFPVFTLTTTFPLISITLRGNILRLFPAPAPGAPAHETERRVLATLLAIVPAFAVCALRVPLDRIISFTGAFCGVFIMFFFPATLVLLARRKVPQHARNALASPLGGSAPVVTVLVFATALFLFNVGMHIVPAAMELWKQLS